MRFIDQLTSHNLARYFLFLYTTTPPPPRAPRLKPSVLLQQHTQPWVVSQIQIHVGVLLQRGHFVLGQPLFQNLNGKHRFAAKLFKFFVRPFHMVAAALKGGLFLGQFLIFASDIFNSTAVFNLTGTWVQRLALQSDERALGERSRERADIQVFGTTQTVH